LAHTVKFLEGWRAKHSTEADLKKGKSPAFSYFVSLDHKMSVANLWGLKFAANYNQMVGSALTLKLGKSKKVDCYYKGHLATSENHKFYFEHKLGLDPHGVSPISNAFTASFQDSLGIGTINGHLYLPC
jgi:hypothetical protein